MKKLVSLLLALAMMLSCTLAMAEVDLSKYVSDPAEKFTIGWLATTLLPSSKATP